MQENLTENFYRRLGTLSFPQSFFEGAMKGISYTLPISLLLLGLKVISPEKFFVLLLSCAMTGGSVGLRHQLPRHRLPFFERAITPLPPEDKAEGFLKGFSVAFSVYWLLVVGKMVKFSPENMVFMCAAIATLTTLGGAWGHYNEMNRPGNRR